MAVADVKLSLSPSEFDITRTALKEYAADRFEFAERKGRYSDQPAELGDAVMAGQRRREAREQSARAMLVFNKLNA